MVEQNNDLVVQANETRQQLAALKYSGEQLRERLSEIQKHADTLKSHVKRELGARNFEYLNSRTDYSTCANHHLADRAALEFKLAIITDEFTSAAITHECQSLELNAEHWLTQLDAFKPDILFVESAWFGVEQSWFKKISGCSPYLVSLVKHCKERNIPTVFWNKEDPAHYETFLPAAALFDYVYTTDAAKIPYYKAELGHDNVFLMPFSCQPKIHNPFTQTVREDAVFFAGSYYPQYPERCNDFNLLVGKVVERCRLDIFDRNLNDKNSEFRFPDTIKQHVVGTLDYAQTLQVYKKYKFGLNLNTIKSSPSMFSRRVLELVASGALVVSNASYALSTLFGELLVASDNVADIDRFLCKATAEHNVIQHLALQKVLNEYTWSRRLTELQNRVLNKPLNFAPLIITVSQVKSDPEKAWVLECFRQQVVTSSYLVLVDDRQQESVVAECARVLSISTDMARRWQLQTCDDRQVFLSYFDVNDFYGAYYLSDMLNLAQAAENCVLAHGRYYEVNHSLNFVANSEAYTVMESYTARCSLIPLSQAVHAENLLGFAKGSDIASIATKPIYCVNYYEYLKNARFLNQSYDSIAELVSINRKSYNTGKPLYELLAESSIQPKKTQTKSTFYAFSAEKLASLFDEKQQDDLYRTCISENGLAVSSRLPATEHQYWFSKVDLPVTEFATGDSSVIQMRLVASGVLDLWVAFIFKDEAGNKLDYSMHAVNHFREFNVPKETATIQLAFKWIGAGEATIAKLELERPLYQ